MEVVLSSIRRRPVRILLYGSLSRLLLLLLLVDNTPVATGGVGSRWLTCIDRAYITALVGIGWSAREATISDVGARELPCVV